MRHINYTKILYPVAIFILVSITILWSWNTLSELFNGPQAQYKHSLALAAVLFITKWSISSGSFHSMHRDHFRKSDRIGEKQHNS